MANPETLDLGMSFWPPLHIMLLQLMVITLKMQEMKRKKKKMKEEMEEAGGAWGGGWAWWAAEGICVECLL